jgi:hypothetical protein
MVDWLVYHAAHQALVCKVHGYALPNLARHLSNEHGDIDHKRRRAIRAEYAGLHLSRPSNADHRHGPANPTPAIDGLPVHEGHACDDCEFLSTSEKVLRVHCKEEHHWAKSEADPVHWSSVKLQTFFTGPKSAIHYFCVTVSAVDPDAGTEAGDAVDGRGRSQRQLVADIKEQWAHERQQQEEMQKVLADGAARHETTNWLKRTGWTAHFTGRDLSEIYACGRMPGRDDHALQRMAAAMDQLFFRRCIDGLRSMPLMTRLLLASPHHQDAHSRPFGPLQEKTSMDRYLIYWTRFFCYCLNVLRLDEAALLEKHGLRL